MGARVGERQGGNAWVLKCLHQIVLLTPSSHKLLDNPLYFKIVQFFPVEILYSEELYCSNYTGELSERGSWGEEKGNPRFYRTVS